MESKKPFRSFAVFSASFMQPLALLLICALSYGVMIPWLGLYWDDWVYSWFPHVLGTQAFVQIFAADRPFLSLIYMITTPLIGENILGWHIFGLLTRWLSSVALWWSLKKIWPGYDRQAFWVALLVTVFPGFGQQWMSLIYSNAFILLAGHLASLGWMALAVRTEGVRRWLLTALALLAVACSLFSTEYFYGLEVLRLFLLWIIAGQLVQGWRARSLKTFKLALPYLTFLVAYTFWRAFLFKSENYQLNGAASLMADPLNALVLLVQNVVNTLIKACLLAWTQTLDLLALPFNRSSTWLVWGMMLAAALLAFFFLVRDIKRETLSEEASSGTWGSQAILPGLLGVAAAIVPFWAAGLGVGLAFPWDRFMLAMMVSSSLFVVGLVDYLVRTDKMKVVILSLLVGLAVGQQFDKANTYRRDWNNQQLFFWQLAWRIPGLEPGTMLLTHELPFTYYSDNSLTAPLNWTYAPDLHAAVQEKMPYILVYTKARLGNSLPTLQPDTPLKIPFRALTFEGNTSNALVIYYNTSQCLRVMDARFTGAKSLPDLPYQLTDAIPLSNLDRIVVNPSVLAAPPAKFFAPEPPHGWCYTFEKAELARQAGQWDGVIQQLEIARAGGFEPLHPSEWLPFIEAYAHTGDWQQAQDLTQRMVEAGDGFHPAVCDLWMRLEQDKNIAEKAAQQLNILNCTALETYKP